MKNRNLITVLVLSTTGFACQMPTALQGSEPWPFEGEELPADWQRDGRYKQDGVVEEAEAAEAQAAAQAAAGRQDETPRPPLYAWDGGVIDSARQGSVGQSAPGHGIEPTMEGRMHIIELYQEVLDERDSLVREVDMLGTTLSKTQDLLERSLRERSELEARIADLVSVQAAVGAENHALAARLTTAQIRRLEAEKQLLESQIAWHRRAGEAVPGRSNEPAGGGQ
jgi:hypothetical protein